MATELDTDQQERRQVEVQAAAQDGAQGDSPEVPERPLVSYALLAGTFNSAFAAAMVKAHRDGKIPDRIAPGDLIMIAVATHKLSRLLTKETVTGFVRTPFTQYKGRAGKAEVVEAPQGRGLRRAIGELLTCPYCIGHWIAGGFMAGQMFAPRHTRVISGMYTVLAISDGLHMVYVAGKQATE